MWKSEASSQGPARIDHFGSVPWNSEASPRGVVGTAHFGSVLWNSEASPWGWGGTDHFGAVFPEPSSGIFSRPARTNPLGSAPWGRGGDLTILGWFHPTQKRAPEPAGGETPPLPQQDVALLKNAKGFKPAPTPSLITLLGEIFGVSPPPAKFLGCWQGNHARGSRGGSPLRIWDVPLVRAAKDLAAGRLPVALSNNKRCLSVSGGFVCLFMREGGAPQVEPGEFLWFRSLHPPWRRGRAGAKPRGQPPGSLMGCGGK